MRRSWSQGLHRAESRVSSSCKQALRACAVRAPAAVARHGPPHMITWGGLKHAANLVLWVPLYSAVQTYAYSLHVVDGLSMQPTFNPGGGLARDWVVVERWGVRVFTAKEGRGGYTRGDVVLLRCALSPARFGASTVWPRTGGPRLCSPPHCSGAPTCSQGRYGCLRRVACLAMAPYKAEDRALNQRVSRPCKSTTANLQS